MNKGFVLALGGCIAFWLAMIVWAVMYVIS